jgi:integrase/recombinase XerC
LDHNTLGKPLSLTSIDRMVRRIGEKAGIKKIVSPHKIRHSAITAYLEASDGDRRGGASFARHSDLSVTQVDDHRKRQQKKATKILSDLA